MKIYNPAGYSYVIVAQVPNDEIEKIDFARCKEPRETLGSYFNRQTIKPSLLVNGGFFNMADGVPCFNYVDEGNVLSEDSAFPCGMGITAAGSLAYTSNIGYRHDWRDFISAYPPLIVGGAEVTVSFATEIAYKARRTSLGYNDDSLFLVAIDSPGMTFKEAKKLLLKIGCTYAINLDGGGSTRMLYNGMCLTSGAHNRPVDNVVAVYLKSGDQKNDTVADDTMIYRVQAGAFARKESAEKLRDAIRAIPDTISAGYANTRIVLTGGLYKVQIGAFKKKANAEKVVEDLGRKGITSFITT